MAGRPSKVVRLFRRRASVSNRCQNNQGRFHWGPYCPAVGNSSLQVHLRQKYLAKNITRKSSLKLVRKIASRASYCSVFLRVPLELFNKYGMESDSLAEINNLLIFTMDFRAITINDTPSYVLLGGNMNGRLRHLEILTGRSEAEGLRSSEWYATICRGDGTFRKSFDVAVKHETVKVPSLFLIDAQIRSYFGDETNEFFTRHVIGPRGTRLHACYDGSSLLGCDDCTKMGYGERSAYCQIFNEIYRQ